MEMDGYNMSKLSLSRLKALTSKEARQTRLESRLNKQLAKEQKKYERYSAVSAEQDRINKIKSEINSYKQRRGSGKKRKVKIGGYSFKI